MRLSAYIQCFSRFQDSSSAQYWQNVRFRRSFNLWIRDLRPSSGSFHWLWLVFQFA